MTVARQQGQQDDGDGKLEKALFLIKEKHEMTRCCSDFCQDVGKGIHARAHSF